MATPVLSITQTTFKGNALTLGGTINFNGDAGGTLAFYVDPVPTGTPYGPEPLVITNGGFSQIIRLTRGTWKVRVVATPSTGTAVTVSTSTLTVNAISSRVVMPGTPGNRVVASLPEKAIAFSDGVAQGRYDAAIAGVSTNKRVAAAGAVTGMMGNRQRLIVYKNNQIVIDAEYAGVMSTFEDGTDVFVLLGTLVSSTINETASLGIGKWTFQLYGGYCYGFALQGSVGTSDSADLVLSHDPILGETLTTEFKFIVPRSVDQSTQ